MQNSIAIYCGHEFRKRIEKSVGWWWFSFASYLQLPPLFDTLQQIKCVFYGQEPLSYVKNGTTVWFLNKVPPSKLL